MRTWPCHGGGGSSHLLERRGEALSFSPQNSGRHLAGCQAVHLITEWSHHLFHIGQKSYTSWYSSHADQCNLDDNLFFLGFFITFNILRRYLVSKESSFPQDNSDGFIILYFCGGFVESVLFFLINSMIIGNFIYLYISFYQRCFVFFQPNAHHRDNYIHYRTDSVHPVVPPLQRQVYSFNVNNVYIHTGIHHT